MYVALDIDDITDVLERTNWYRQNFNFDPRQRVDNNTVYLYCDWSIGDGDVVYIPFTFECKIDFYKARIDIIVDPAEELSQAILDEWHH